jgi:hypothetical protein
MTEYPKLTKDLDFVSTCLKRLALSKKGVPSIKIMANIGTDGKVHFDYFHTMTTPLKYDLRLEVNDAMLLDRAKDALRDIGHQMLEIIEAIEGTDMVLLAYVNDEPVTHLSAHRVVTEYVDQRHDG